MQSESGSKLVSATMLGLHISKDKSEMRLNFVWEVSKYAASGYFKADSLCAA
jgi:hypothetical protein